jgi:hypothetical protein
MSQFGTSNKSRSVATMTMATGLLAFALPGIAQERAADATAVAQESLEERIARLEAQSEEWRSRESVFHLAGFADAGYASESGGENAFNAASFNPIVHFQYQDRVLLEAELETTIGASGETNLELEYATIDLVLTDHLVLIAGKFLSPLGNFQQNIHPSWINKMASPPPGFDHDGAAPATDLGLQLRGGYQFGSNRQWTYAVYVSNGPELEAEEDRLSAVLAEGFGRDADGAKVYGGRVSVLPTPTLEIGLSAAQGRARITQMDAMEAIREPARDYDVLGADLSWRWGQSMDLRAEYIRQKVGASPASAAPDPAEWEAWYMQCAYVFPSRPWELVARYGQFRSPDTAMSADQTALGINYRFSANAIAKVSYEFNSAPRGASNAKDRLLVQLTYGF